MLQHVNWEGDGSRRALAALMLGAGTFHLSRPGLYQPLIPSILGRPRAWVVGTGILQLLCGVLLLWRPTRRLGGWLTATVIVVVFPGNVQAVIDGGMPVDGPLGSPAAAWLRLPLQLPLLWWALRHTRPSPSGGSVHPAAPTGHAR